ncbi:MAG: aminotransferase class I/II-fold pyridoxal phosphate-dependent enzyme [Pseudomonadota bacterium]
MFEPKVGHASLQNLAQVFESKWLGRGALVKDFEKNLAEFFRIQNDQIHTIASCTDALFGVFPILQLEPGSEVLVSSVSFPAVGSAIVDAGLQPKIIDIDLATGNVSLEAVAKHLSPRTSAVFITHYGGIPVDVPQLRRVVGSDVRIIEDAACALGTFVGGQACGTLGDYGTWSFDAMKLLTCGEGGGLFIPNAAEMERAKEYFYLGLPSQVKSGIDRQATDSRWWEYQLNLPGRRSLFTNVNAAIGLPQFGDLSKSLQRRCFIREQYCQAIDSLQGIGYLDQSDPQVDYANYFFTVVTDRRDALAMHLKNDGIYTTFRYYPLHLIDIFKKYDMGCENASTFSDTALNLPIHQNLTDEGIDRICQSLKRFYA